MTRNEKFVKSIYPKAVLVKDSDGKFYIRLNGIWERIGSVCISKKKAWRSAKDVIEKFMLWKLEQ